MLSFCRLESFAQDLAVVVVVLLLDERRLAICFQRLTFFPEQGGHGAPQKSHPLSVLRPLPEAREAASESISCTRVLSVGSASAPQCIPFGMALSMVLTDLATMSQSLPLAAAHVSSAGHAVAVSSPGAAATTAAFGSLGFFASPEGLATLGLGGAAAVSVWDASSAGLGVAMPADLAAARLVPRGATASGAVACCTPPATSAAALRTGCCTAEVTTVGGVPPAARATMPPGCEGV